MNDGKRLGGSGEVGEPHLSEKRTPGSALNPLHLAEIAFAAQPAALDPAVLDELAQAEAHLHNGVTAANAQGTQALAQSIGAIAREANDLTRVQMRGWRLAAKLTQTEVARRIGARPKQISDFEAGRRALLPDLMRLMRQAMGAVEPMPKIQETTTALQMAQTAVPGEETRAFEVVASGTTMEPAIHHGDRLVVSSDVELEAGRIVVAMHGDVRIVKRLVNREGVLVLRSDNVDEEVKLSDVSVQGVIVELRRTV